MESNLNPKTSNALTHHEQLFTSKVYSRMALAVLASFVTGLLLCKLHLTIAAIRQFGSPFVWAIFGLQILTVILFEKTIARLNTSQTRIIFAFYTFLTGITLSIIFYAYNAKSLISIFGFASMGFVSLVVFGKNTKKSLGGIGTFCLMGLSMTFVMCIASALGTYVTSLEPYLPSLSFVSGAVGSISFAGITAWEAQKIRNWLNSVSLSDLSDAELDVSANHAAFSMYLNFIGLFTSLVRLLGKRS